MPNLRLIHDNAADRATIAASTTAGSLLPANMQTDLKGQLHRSTSTAVTYTLTWASFEDISGVALPATNLTASATIRLKGYDATTGGTQLFDSGVQYACPGLTLEMWDWSLPINGNAFAFGGSAKAACWLDNVYSVKRLEIILDDSGNAAGYIDCARVVAGSYWSPTYNADYGATNSTDDQSKNFRNDAGDLLTDRAYMNETMKLDLKLMPEADRARINQIMRSNGVNRPVFISLTPDNANPLLEQDLMIYGKRQNSPVTYTNWAGHNTTMNIEGW